MKLHSVDKEFEVYELKSKDNLLVAIPIEFMAVIDVAIKEFGEIDLIPSDRTVRGIFLNNSNGSFELNKDDPQNDIVINQIIIK
jgi:hypothetical protein